MIRTILVFALLVPLPRGLRWKDVRLANTQVKGNQRYSVDSVHGLNGVRMGQGVSSANLAVDEPSAVFPTSGPRQGQKSIADLPPFVLEDGHAHLLRKDGGGDVLRVDKGRIRTERILNDFVLTLDFRLADPKSDALLAIRALTLPGYWPVRGYGVVLSSTKTSGVMVARGADATNVTGGGTTRLAAGIWHAMVLSAEGPRVTVSIDGAIASVTNITALCGALVFQVDRGALDLRSVTVRPLPSAVTPYTDTPDLRSRLTPARVLKEVRPSYTVGALHRRAEGNAELDAIVLPDGTVGAITVTKLPDPDLEQAAVAAVTQWRFAPATLDGKPVPFEVKIVLTFVVR